MNLGVSSRFLTDTVLEIQKFDENYGKASGVPYWVNTRCDYEDDFIRKIKNWQFNPPV